MRHLGIGLLLSAAIISTGVLSGCAKRRTPRAPSQQSTPANAPKTHATKKESMPAGSPQAHHEAVREKEPARPGMVREVQDTVTGMAGGAAFKAGQKSKSKIQGIQEMHQQRTNAALEME